MVKVLIIEDEIPARKKLKRFLKDLDTKTEVVAELDTVARAVDVLNTTNVDLIFSDIELLDGNAFEVYKQVRVFCPIIFTTAYDQFLMNVFETNGIAYLLKPFSRDRFQAAWDKFLLLKKSASEENQQLNILTNLIHQTFTKKAYKEQFTIHKQQGIYFLKTENISFFEANEGVIFAFDITGKKHLLSESSLKSIEQNLSSEDFFRINRSVLLNKQNVEKIERYTKNTLAIIVKGLNNHLKTSQSNTASFREWIEK